MDSLANYGSDDDYEENSNDKMGTYKSGQSQPWHHQELTSARTEADVNYDEVQMDLSEESNNNNSGEDNDESPRQYGRATDRKRSYRSRSRDGKSHEYKSTRPRDAKTRDDERDRARKHESKSKYDRDGPSGNHEDRSDRSKHERDGAQGYEDRHERAKNERNGQNSHEERPKHGSAHVEERSKYGKDEKSNKSREERPRKYNGSGSKERRRSGSRERRRSRSPRRNEYRRRSNSKERDRCSNNRGYGKRFDRTSNKMAQLEKLGIEIKTPDAEFVTPQMLLQRSMDEQVQKVKHSTGIELPKYYNPAAMNPARYADQIQKRRLLWQKKDAVATVPAAQPTGTAHVAQQAAGKVWEQTTFAQDQDGKVASKFKRLMGIRETPATVTGTSGDVLKKQEEMFSSMEQQYEVARTATHTMRGVGLGFGTFQNYPR